MGICRQVVHTNESGGGKEALTAVVHSDACLQHGQQFNDERQAAVLLLEALQRQSARENKAMSDACGQ